MVGQCARRRHRHPQRSRMSHMSEQTGSEPGSPPEAGEDAHVGKRQSQLAQYKGHVHKRHVPSRGQQATTARRRVSALLLPGRT
jgi:hypothetical protein